jgi:phosphinothricin acetyltransferase
MRKSQPNTVAVAAHPAPLVRMATAADCAAIAEIYNQAIRARRSTMDTEPVTAGYFLDLINGLTLREMLLVAETAGQVRGWGIVKRYSDRPGYRVACESSVYVHEAHRERGIGATVQRALLKRAADLGYRHIVAKILAVNGESVAFHKRFGFEDVGVQRGIGLVDGVWHDVAILQYRIDTDASRERLATTYNRSSHR